MSKFCLCIAITIWCSLLVWVDKTAFKQNDSFNLRFILPRLSYDPEWNISSISADQQQSIDQILTQKFTYLAKGMHAFAFLSEDGRYVIKFHRYPSHMRILPWINRPLAYYFSQKKQAVKEHDRHKLNGHLQSYKNSFEHLQEETGLLCVHIGNTPYLGKMKEVTLIDRKGNSYQVPLSETTFMLQQRADLIYPTLDQCDLEKGKQVISSVIQLFMNCCQKGYVDQDPILRKNYGLLLNEQIKAIHIDIGDMAYQENIKLKENYIPYIKEMTESLRKRLEKNYPELLDHYHQTIDLLQR